jgi:MerR family transcriptional regulator, light-induced transcriptional regulator
MIEDRFVSPKDLARAIGASESSLKRWVDDGRIGVSRTAGGHRRISVREALRFIRATGQELVEPQAIGLSRLQAEAAGTARALPDEALVEALLGGDAEAARRVMMSRFLAGESVAALCDGAFTTALRKMSENWQHRADGIFLEHRTTVLAIQLLMQLRAVIPQAPTDAPVAVGGAVAADPYLVPTMMASVVLAAEGWQEVNLGPNVPGEAFCEALLAHRPALLWISFSAIDGADRFIRDWDKLLDLAEERETTVVVGGRMFPPKAAVAAGRRYHHLPSMQALEGFARALKSRPSSGRPVL